MNEAHSPQHHKRFLLSIAKLETLHPLGKLLIIALWVYKSAAETAGN